MSAFLCAGVFFLIVLLLPYLLARREGFIGDPDAQRCGVDTGPCPFGKACMNGWCIENRPPAVPQTTGLPVFPSGKQF
jgi:hypothetical protein